MPRWLATARGLRVGLGPVTLCRVSGSRARSRRSHSMVGSETMPATASMIVGWEFASGLPIYRLRRLIVRISVAPLRVRTLFWLWRGTCCRSQAYETWRQWAAGVLGRNDAGDRRLRCVLRVD